MKGEQLSLVQNGTDRNSFYNTPKLKGAELAVAERNAKKKKWQIYKLFQDSPTTKMTALTVAEKTLFHESTCRRSCHQLEKDKYLIRLEEQKLEKYGVPNHYYILK